MEIKSECKKCLRFLKKNNVNSSYFGFCLTKLSTYLRISFSRQYATITPLLTYRLSIILKFLKHVANRPIRLGILPPFIIDGGNRSSF